MTTDTLETWEKWPVAALVAAAGLNTAIWYAGDVLPVEARGILPWLITIAAIASVVAIDGSLIATIAGRRQGRRNRWGVANICVTALFTALAALSAHSAIVGIAPWLHGLFAATIVTYAMHLEQPRADVGIALALREQELTRREADVSIRAQSIETLKRELTPIMVSEPSSPTLPEPQPPLELPLVDRASRIGSIFRTRNWSGYVYVISNNQGAYKIGMAIDVAQRVASISPVTPYGIQLIHSIKADNRRVLERRLHECFADRRLRGEWFALTDSDLDAIIALGDELPSADVDEAIDLLSAIVNMPTTIDMTPVDTMPEIVRMKDVAKLSFAEIGDQLGISRQAAWQQYKNAKKGE